MEKNLLIVGDPLQTLKLGFDSSIALSQIALNENWKVYWCEPGDVVYFDREIVIHNPVKIEHADTNKITSCPAASDWIALSEFHSCFIRKDPPFDDSYKDLCWILASQRKTRVVNSAHALLTYHEKSLPWNALNDGILSKENIIPTCVSKSWDVISAFCDSDAFANQQGIVCKPWLGYAGSGIQLFENKESLKKWFFEQQANQAERLIVQPCLKEIQTHGDRRVIVAGGEIMCHFVRMPKAGEIISNIARGGSAVLSKMTQDQEDMCKRLAKYLDSKSISFAGIDLIENKIGEINITSPTGIRVYEQLTGINVSESVFHHMTESKK